MMRQWTLSTILGLALGSAPAFGAVTVTVGNADPVDGKATVAVSLSSGDATVGGIQNDILFDTTKVTLASATACRINAAIGDREAGCEEDPVSGPCKTLSRNLASCGTTPTPPGCEGQPANISRFRGIVAATAVPNTNEIPDGSVLYSCEFTVASTPAALTNTNVVASNPSGGRLDATGVNGSIGGGAEPTPTATAEPTEPPQGCTESVCVNVGNGNLASAPGKVTIEVVATGDNIGGTQNDILFDTTKVSLPSATACRINAAIGDREAGCEEDPVVGPCKTLSRNLASCGTTPTPPGCEGQPANVSRFRGIVAATAVPNTNVIPSGSVLYTCEFDVTAGTTLDNTNIVVSSPSGTRLDPSGGSDGVITVGGGGENTPTPTEDVPPTATPTSPPVLTSTPTNTVVVNTNTPTRAPATATATSTRPAGGGADDDDGCHIAASGSTSRGWMLLIPAIGLLAFRRRRSA